MHSAASGPGFRWMWSSIPLEVVQHSGDVGQPRLPHGLRHHVLAW